MLVEPAAQSSGLLGSQIQGLVLLTLKEIKYTYSGAKHFISNLKDRKNVDLQAWSRSKNPKHKLDLFPAVTRLCNSLFSNQ